MKNIYTTIGIVSLIVISTFSLTARANSVNLNNDNTSNDCKVEYFKVKETNEQRYFKFLIIENKDNVAYVLEGSENGKDFISIQIKEGFKSPNKLPLLYCFSEAVNNNENTSYRIKRISTDGIINYSGSIELKTGLTSNRWLACMDASFSDDCSSESMNSFAFENSKSKHKFSAMETVDIGANISIYPNQGPVSIDFGNLDKISMKVFDIKGQLVHQENEITGPSHQFELNELPGIYFIDILVANNQQRFTIVKK